MSTRFYMRKARSGPEAAAMGILREMRLTRKGWEFDRVHERLFGWYLAARHSKLGLLTVNQDLMFLEAHITHPDHSISSYYSGIDGKRISKSAFARLGGTADPHVQKKGLQVNRSAKEARRLRKMVIAQRKAMVVLVLVAALLVLLALWY